MAKRRKNYVPKDEAEIQEVRDSVEGQNRIKGLNESGLGDSGRESGDDVYQESQTSFKDDNKMKFLALAGIIALIAVAFTVYKVAFKGPKEAKASTAIYKAEEQFARDSFALALENPGGGYDGFLDVVEKYNGTKAGNLAKYYAGISYLNLGRYDDAIQYLEAYKAPDELTSITKNGALGDAYAESGDEAKALSFYKKAADSNNDLLTPYYLKKVGMMNQKNQDNAAALAAFKKIKNNFGASTQATDIDRLIAKVQ